MKLYEILFIVHPNYEENRMTKIVDNVKEKITNNGGTIINVDEMGKKKLAYKIDNQKYGSYILIHFESEPQFIAEFKNWLKIQSQILARIIVKLDKIDSKEENKKDNIEEKKEVVSDEVENEDNKDNKFDDEDVEDVEDVKDVEDESTEQDVQA
ncbi:MAG: 30S ribosomal protein S6 [Candidatus Marinimicrobia bacterium]|nr:30S ribosomal protein S6 [Candidatus Neomarinimicrobiota bacterium]